jgi:hypothetical protein
VIAPEKQRENLHHWSVRLYRRLLAEKLVTVGHDVTGLARPEEQIASMAEPVVWISSFQLRSNAVTRVTLTPHDLRSPHE